MIVKFSENNFQSICDILAKGDQEMNYIIQTYGYPPMWTRANTFETLVHIILEQQVSLASALAAMNNLRKILVKVTPKTLMSLNDEELRAAYFSRQKISYVRNLATSVENGEIDFELIAKLPDNEIRAKLNRLKGIGNWTIDVYLMMALQRADVFPIGDLAAVNALKKIKKLPPYISKDELLQYTLKWKPYRTVVTMILWHYYLSLRIKKVKPTAGGNE